MKWLAEYPVWWSSSAAIGDRFIAKLAWSQPAALRLAHEIGILTAVGREPKVPLLPEVIASSTDPDALQRAGASTPEPSARAPRTRKHPEP